MPSKYSLRVTVIVLQLWIAAQTCSITVNIARLALGKIHKKQLPIIGFPLISASKMKINIDGY